MNAFEKYLKGLSAEALAQHVKCKNTAAKCSNDKAQPYYNSVAATHWDNHIQFERILDNYQRLSLTGRLRRFFRIY